MVSGAYLKFVVRLNLAKQSAVFFAVFLFLTTLGKWCNKIMNDST